MTSSGRFEKRCPWLSQLQPTLASVVSGVERR
jgi:hypothetical protein